MVPVLNTNTYGSNVQIIKVSGQFIHTLLQDFLKSSV